MDSHIVGDVGRRPGEVRAHPTRQITPPGRRAPFLFNLVVALVAAKILLRCLDRDWGFRDGDFYLPMLIFADNVRLLDLDPRRLQKMFRLWKQTLVHFGWDTTTTECAWCTACNFDDVQIRDNERATVVRAAAKGGFKVSSAPC